MLYLIAKHRLSDFDKWNRLFRSHAEAQRKAGLHILHVLRDVTDPSIVVALFKVDDLARAQAFTGAPGAHEAGRIGGVITVELSYLSD